MDTLSVPANLHTRNGCSAGSQLIYVELLTAVNADTATLASARDSRVNKLQWYDSGVTTCRKNRSNAVVQQAAEMPGGHN
jgi:hypothetical protein